MEDPLFYNVCRTLTAQKHCEVINHAKFKEHIINKTTSLFSIFFEMLECFFIDFPFPTPLPIQVHNYYKKPSYD